LDLRTVVVAGTHGRTQLAHVRAGINCFRS